MTVFGSRKQRRDAYTEAVMSAPLRQALGARLLAAREAAGLSREELATRVGTDGGTLASYETGGSMPLLGRLRAIATEVGVAVDYLLEGGNETPPVPAPGPPVVHVSTDVRARLKKRREVALEPAKADQADPTDAAILEELAAVRAELAKVKAQLAASAPSAARTKALPAPARPKIPAARSKPRPAPRAEPTKKAPSANPREEAILGELATTGRCREIADRLRWNPSQTINELRDLVARGVIFQAGAGTYRRFGLTQNEATRRAEVARAELAKRTSESQRRMSEARAHVPRPR